ncbi:MAG: cell wall hydrolase [Bacilli bacterium]
MLIKYSNKELDLCARLMRAEALAEGDLAMLMVGNVIVNRAIANCLDFKNIRTITDVVYQKPGGFVGTNSSLFNSGSATTKEKELAKRVLKGEYYHPATNALWFYGPKKNEECKATWFNQRNTGRYKGHCFYAPDPGVCNELY